MGKKMKEGIQLGGFCLSSSRKLVTKSSYEGSKKWQNLGFILKIDCYNLMVD